MKAGKAKKNSLEKPGLGKGKLGKAKAKAKSKLGKVCKRNLEKMGKLSLEEKVQQAAEAAEDPEEQAEELQKNLSVDEKKRFGVSTIPTSRTTPWKRRSITSCPKRTKALQHASGFWRRKVRGSSTPARLSRPLNPWKRMITG